MPPWLSRGTLAADPGPSDIDTPFQRGASKRGAPLECLSEMVLPRLFCNGLSKFTVRSQPTLFVPFLLKAIQPDQGWV